jgi:hypothetical protein
LNKKHWESPPVFPFFWRRREQNMLRAFGNRIKSGLFLNYKKEEE